MRFFLPFLFLCLASACSAKELKIFLLTGQSNSLGAVKGSPASPELLKKYEPGKTLYWHENFGQRGRGVSRRFHVLGAGPARDAAL